VVLDGSALLSLLLDEPGRDHVEPALDDACMSTVNLAEVYTCLVKDGHDLAGILARLDALPIQWVAFSDVHAAKAGELWHNTRQADLSLGDRACLALAIERGLPVLTADRVWDGLGLPVEVRLIR
jgi:PIN domain nuclease of toxin-antitoxin system